MLATLRGHPWLVRLLSSAAAVAAVGGLVGARPAAAASGVSPGGAFTCDFALSKQSSPLDLAPTIERDRMYQSARPGFVRKFIPLGIDSATGELLGGGRYLFRTAEQAREYQTWIFRDFVLDGVAFFDRPLFAHPECHAWEVVGVADLAAYDDHQVVVRTERFRVPAGISDALLADRWSQILATAHRRGLTGVWLLYDKPERLVSLVYFADRLVPPAPNSLDLVSLVALQQAPPLGAAFDDQGWERTFDRTEWVLTLWFQFALGDRGRPSVWPNSPPLPLPYPGDGVCEFSRGERTLTAPTDCRPTCGNRVADPGETTHDCPGDVRPFRDEEYAA